MCVSVRASRAPVGDLGVFLSQVRMDPAQSSDSTKPVYRGTVEIRDPVRKHLLAKLNLDTGMLELMTRDKNLVYTDVRALLLGQPPARVLNAEVQPAIS